MVGDLSPDRTRGAVPRIQCVSIVAAVPMDDDQDDGSALGPPPPPDDRLWRHPSEIGATQPIRIVTTTPVRGRVLTVGLMSGLLGAAAMLALLVSIGALDHRRPTVAVEHVRTGVPTTATELRSVAAKALPALARVDATTPNGTVSGTAVVFRTDGYLLAVADLVKAGAALTVQLYDGTTLPAHLLGVDTSSDVAVIKVDQPTIHAAVLAHESDLQLGEPAIAIDCVAGRPNRPDISPGLISALGRRIDADNGTTLVDMIQTNVHPPSSNAGSALIDSSGAVIGLLTGSGAHIDEVVADTTTTDGTDSETLVPRYATPNDYAEQVADQLISTGRVLHPWLGIETSDLSTDAQAALGQSGARIDKVLSSSPAQRAGLMVGDVVVGLDKRRVTSASSLIVSIRSDKPHQSVTITYVRDGTTRVAVATLADRDSGT
jgi:putative serine protease PepD